MKNKIISLISAAAILMSLTPIVSRAATEEANPDTSDWFVYEYPKASQVSGTILDSSDALDAPAGKHGFLNHYEGDTFKFEDGTDAHFWGVNVAAAHYMERDEAVERAARIAQSGFNLVRLHLTDSGELWGPKKNGGRVMREDKMDKLCFFINELKSRGVYIYLDLMIGTPVTSDMSGIYDLEHTGKVYSYFVSDLKEDYIERADAFLNYENRYTGRKLKDEPAIVLMELKNESSLCQFTYGSKKYSAELTAQYNEWLRKKYGTTEELDKAWSNDKDTYKPAPALKDGENLEDGTVKICVDGNAGRRAVRWNDEYMFKAEVQEKFFNEVISHLRSIGVKNMVTGSTSWAGNGIETFTYYSNRNTDYTDTHIYSGNWPSHKYTSGMTRSDEVNSVLDQGNDDDAKNMISQASVRRVFGHPYVISEWNDNPPNKYRGETILMMGAYSALQGMNSVLFQWHSEDVNDVTASSANVRKEVHESATQPEYMAAFPAIGRIFQRGDVQETDASFSYKRYQGNEQFAAGDQYMLSADMYGHYMGFVGKTGIVFEDQYDEDIYDNRVLQLTKDAYEGDKNFVSATGELSMDFNNKIFRMNTPRAQAVSGYTSGKAIELDDVKFEINNYHATAYLNSVDDAPLYSSKKILLTVIGDTRNTGQVMSDDEKTLENGGTAPILVEPITGKVTIKTNTRITVKAVTPNGKVVPTFIPTTKTDGGYTFEMKSQYKTMYYQITRTTQGVSNAHISLGNSNAHDVYTDVSSSNPKKEEIERSSLAGFIGAASGSAFEPNTSVKKKEFVSAVMRALRVDKRVWYDPNGNVFNDLPNTDPTYGCMDGARYLGLVKVDKNKNVYPDASVTRGEAMTIIAGLLGDGCYPGWRTKRPDLSFTLSKYSDYSSSNANNEAYRLVLGLGYMDAKDGKIAENDVLTRQETADIAFRLAWKAWK